VFCLAAVDVQVGGPWRSNRSRSRRRERPAAYTACRNELTVEAIEVARLQLRQRHRSEPRKQIAVDEAASLLHRRRREVALGHLEPGLEQLDDRGAAAHRKAALGLADHLVQHPLRLALATPNGARRISLFAGDRVVAEVYPQLPRITPLPNQALQVRTPVYIGTPLATGRGKQEGHSEEWPRPGLSFAARTGFEPVPPP